MFYLRCIFYTFYINTGKMIIDDIKALFNFIEFLHSNIDNFNNIQRFNKTTGIYKAEKKS